MSSSLRMLEQDEEEDNTPDVKWEDQQRINTFSKINTRFQNLKTRQEELEQEKEALDDIATELELADEDDLVLYKIGEAFLHIPHASALERIEADQASIEERMQDVLKSSETCESEMKSLKLALYAKFGKAINLDD